MTMRTVLHTLLVIWAVCWGAPVIAVPVGPSMNIDIPAANSVMPQTFQLAGWAIDTDAPSGAGVDAIEVWGYPAPGSGAAPIYLGPAVYGVVRPDVGQAFGARFSNSGWYLNIVGRPPAVYEIHVYARSTVTGTFNQERALTVTVTADPRMAIDLPSATTTAVHQPFSIVGWAIDLASGSGTGVSTIHVWSRRLDVPESPDVFVGVAAYGSARPDVGAAFGERFTDSAYVQTVTGLAPGLYRFVVYARSTLTSTFNQAQVLDLDVDQSVAAPIFSMSAGTYAASFSLEAPTSTPRATVRYTTNGAEPTTTSPTGPVWVDTSMTVKAKAFRTGWTPSTTTTAAYVLEVATPTVSVPAGAYITDFSVQVTSPTSSSEVRYTTNGTEPTLTSPLLPGLQYFVNGTVTLKVKAFRSGWTPSATTTAVYTRQPPPPVASPVAGTYAVGQVVMLTASGPIDLIRYTTDGMEPTASSPIFDSVNPLVLTEPITLRARSFHPQYAPSTEIQVAYVTRVATPTLSPNEGQYQTLPLVTITTATPSATIRYTTNRTDPTESSPTYSIPISTQNFTSVRARAYKTGWAPSDVAVATYWDLTPAETSSVATVVSGVNPALPAAIGGTVSIGVSGGGMTTDPASVFAYRNGTRLSGAALQISTGGVNMPNVLVDGENRLELEALDQDGLLFNETVTVWAGNRTLTVTVRKRQGSATVTGATVRAQLQRAGAVSSVGTTNGAGQLAVSSLPSSHEVALVVTAPGFRTSETTVTPTATSATVYLDEATMDFASLAGWNVQTPRAWTQPHTEASTPLVPCADCLGHDGSADPQQSVAVAGDGAGNLDLVLDTKNLHGAQTVARTVAVAPGTSQVTARFRFQTDEMWWALPGRSAFAYQNDWFFVRLQPVRRPAEAVTYTRTVSQLLGAAQFDQYAATPWYTLSLPTQFTDAVEVTFTVANAVTNGHLSILYADVVQETTHRIAAVELRDLIDANDPYALDRLPSERQIRQLSLSPMPIGLVSYDGYLRLNGTIRIEGEQNETLTDVRLEIWDDGVKVATAPLARPVSSSVRTQLLNVQFGADGVLEVGELEPGIAPVLFELEAATLATLNQSNNTSNLVVQVHATLASGGAVRHLDLKRRFTKFVLYTSANRYDDDRDLGDCVGLKPADLVRWKRPPFPCGGDSWALPTTVSWAVEASSPSVTWGDFSNMHGGAFPVHTGHRLGDTVDGYFPGYRNMDAAAAQRMLAFVEAHRTRIVRVLVSFSTAHRYRPEGGCGGPLVDPLTLAPNVQNDFWNVIKNATLTDGRTAREVILNERGHCGHFDVKVIPPPNGGSQ